MKKNWLHRQLRAGIQNLDKPSMLLPGPAAPHSLSHHTASSQSKIISEAPKVLRFFSTTFLNQKNHLIYFILHYFLAQQFTPYLPSCGAYHLHLTLSFSSFLFPIVLFCLRDCTKVFASNKHQLIKSVYSQTTHRKVKNSPYFKISALFIFWFF